MVLALSEGQITEQEAVRILELKGDRKRVAEIQAERGIDKGLEY